MALRGEEDAGVPGAVMLDAIYLRRSNCDVQTNRIDAPDGARASTGMNAPHRQRRLAPVAVLPETSILQRLRCAEKKISLPLGAQAGCIAASATSVRRRDSRRV